VALAFYQQWGEVYAWRPTSLQTGLLVVLTLVYAGALMLLALNWSSIMGILVAEPLPRALLLLSYTKSQIAKYVPGNIVHLVGRHVYLHNRGVPHRPLAAASMMELASLPLAAAIALALLVPVIDVDDVASTAVIGVIWTLPVALVAGIALSTLFMRETWRAPFVIVLIRATGFMLCQGVIFAIILAAVGGSFVVLAIPVAITAWLLGFLTPGAPGGIAVREAIIVALFSYAGTEESVLLAAILMRLVTTAGDLVLFLSGNMFLTRGLIAEGKAS